MTQYLRPTGDDSIGDWSNENGLTTTLYVSVDETVASDSDYAKSGSWPSGDTLRWKLSVGGADPLVSTSHILAYRIGKIGTNIASAIVRLVQGAATIIGEWNHLELLETPEDVTQTLTATEADSITDYTDLYLEIEAHGAQFGSFSLFTTVSGIRDQPELNERTIQKLNYYDGKFWPSYGDYGGTGNARALYSVDVDTGAVTSEIASVNADFVKVYQTSNGDMFLTHSDPSVGTWPSYSKRISGTWSAGGSDVISWHVFDFVEWNGAYYMCGTKYDTGGNDQACVWKSTNGGASWTEDFLGTSVSGIARRLHGFLAFDDRLYVQEEINFTIDSTCTYYTTGSGGWVQDTSYKVFTSSNGLITDQVRWGSYIYFLRRSLGDMQNTNVGTRPDFTVFRVPLDRSTGASVFVTSKRSIAYHAGTDSLYVLDRDGSIDRYTDGLSSTRKTVVPRENCPVTADSIEFVGDVLYIGDAGGRIWKSNIADLDPAYTYEEYFKSSIFDRGWVETDTGSQIYANNADLYMYRSDVNSATAGWGDPTLVKTDAPYSRSNTLRLDAYVTHMSGSPSGYFGFLSTTTPTDFSSGVAAIGKNAGTLARSRPGTGAVNVYNAGGLETWPGREYRICVRNQGAVFYMRGYGLTVPYIDDGSTRATWLPVAMEHLSTTADLYLGMSWKGDVLTEHIHNYFKIKTDAPAHAGDVEDTFTRANSTTSLGSAEIGGSWTAVSGTWGISSNQAYCTDTASGDRLAVVDSGVSDGIVACSVGSLTSTSWAGVVFRCDGTDQNYWRAYYDRTNFRVDKVVGGVVTNVLTQADTVGTGTIQITLYENHISVHKGSGANTVVSTAITDSDLQSNTRHGLYTNQTVANARFNDFYVFGPMVD